MVDELRAKLAEAGLCLVQVLGADVPVVPPQVAGFASSCGAGDLLLGESLDLKDASLVEKANSTWLRLAVEGGLFGTGGRSFLLATDRRFAGGGEGSWWTEVELLDDWDLAGAGAEGGLLGLSRGRPSFTMLSKAGDVIVRVTCSEIYLDVVLVSRPHQVELLRRQAEFMVGWRGTDEFTRAVIRQWLDANTFSDHP